MPAGSLAAGTICRWTYVPFALQPARPAHTVSKAMVLLTPLTTVTSLAGLDSRGAEVRWRRRVAPHRHGRRTCPAGHYAHRGPEPPPGIKSIAGLGRGRWRRLRRGDGGRRRGRAR